MSEMVSAKYDPAKSSLVFLNDYKAVKPPDASDSLTESVCCFVFRRTLAYCSYFPRKGGGHDHAPSDVTAFLKTCSLGSLSKVQPHIV